MKRAGFTFDAFGPYFSPMALDNGLADGQAETGAFGLGDPGRWHGGKLIKYGFETFLRNSHSPVFNRYRYIGWIFNNFNPNFGSGIGKFDGVLNQVDQNLFYNFVA